VLVWAGHQRAARTQKFAPIVPAQGDRFSCPRGAPAGAHRAIRRALPQSERPLQLPKQEVSIWRTRSFSDTGGGSYIITPSPCGNQPWVEERSRSMIPRTGDQTSALPANDDPAQRPHRLDRSFHGLGIRAAPKLTTQNPRRSGAPKCRCGGLGCCLALAAARRQGPTGVSVAWTISGQ